MSQLKVSKATDARLWPWILTALIAHTAWGAYPVLARYLQTVSRLPSLSLLTAGTLTALLAFVLIQRPRLNRQLLRFPIFWFFIVVIIIRAVTNLFAARFTLSIYVQLITLMTPFIVVLLSATLLRDRIPFYTGRAITLALVGAILMISGDFSKTGGQPPLGPHDWLGIGLALASSFSLALYMILIRRSTQYHISGESMLFIQLLAILVVAAPLSFLFQEDWGQWRQLQSQDWLIFGTFALGVIWGANTGQIAALRHLGAPMVSSLMAWRLVSALIFGGLLLGERLTSVWQFLGAAIVLVTITWYLWQQRGSNAVLATGEQTQS